MRHPELKAALCCAALGWIFQWAIVQTNYGGNWTGLFCHGSAHPLPAGLAFEHIYVFPNSGGYDGQSYHFVAHDPLNRGDIGRAVPDPGRRFPRILVPGLAHVLALGRPEWIDTSLFAVNLFFLGLGAYWLACLLPRPMFAVLYVLLPASISSLDRMLIDLALTSLALGFALYAKREERVKLWVIFAAAALCRESGFLLFGGYAIRLIALREYRRLAIFSTAILPALVWNLRSGAGGFGLPIPLYGILDAVLHPRTYPYGFAIRSAIQMLQAIQLAGLLLSLALAFRGVRNGGKQPVANYCLLLAVFGLCIPPGTYDDPLAGARVLGPLLILQFLSGERFARLPMLMATPRVWLELLPQCLRLVGL